MPRQNPSLLPSAANLLAAAGSIRAALSAGDFEGLKKGLTSAADGFEQAGAAIATLERRLRDLGQPNVDLSGRSAPVVVSGDRILGGIPVQGILPNLAGQSLDLTFASQVAHVTSMDHGTGGYLELDLDGLGVTINAHGGTITLTGTLSLSAVLPVTQGGTGTATGSITGPGALAFTSGGATTVALKPGTNSTTAIQLQNAAGTAILSVNTTANIASIIGSLATAKGTLACVNGANNNLTLPAATYMSVTGPTAAFNITGFVAGVDGQHLEIWNVTGFAMTLRDQNAGSTAGNQIYTNAGADLVLGAVSFASLIYDAGSAIWVVRSHT